MKNQKMYEADDKMISLIADNYSLLDSLGRFGINLGFGDKTVSEVCKDQGVDTYTFLAIVNFSINGATVSASDYNNEYTSSNCPPSGKNCSMHSTRRITWQDSSRNSTTTTPARYEATCATRSSTSSPMWNGS